jgi:hypothetical protein
MSVSSVGSTNPFSYLQKLLQPDDSDPSEASAPSDPLQSLFQAATGVLAAAAPDDASGSCGTSQFSPDVMKALLSVQGDQGSSGASKLQSLFGKFDTDGDGQISQSEFENAIGPDANKSKVDALFAKIDGNGDGSVSQDEMQSAIQKMHGGHHHHHASSGSQGSDPLQALLSGASADGTTSQSATNADGSSTTTITYADGTKVEMTTPAASGNSDASANPETPNFANLLRQLISLQAQLAAPTMNLSI